MKVGFIAYANPANFLHIAAKLLPWLWGLTALAFGLGLFGAFTAPPDYQQGGMVRIMYIPFSGSLGGDASLYADGDLGGRLAGLAPSARECGAEGCRAARRRLHFYLPYYRLPLGQADVGNVLGVGRPAYFHAGPLPDDLGLIGLWQTIEDTSRAARAASIMTLVGFTNIPIVKFSVDCGIPSTSRLPCSGSKARRSPARCFGHCSSCRLHTRFYS